MREQKCSTLFQGRILVSSLSRSECLSIQIHDTHNVVCCPSAFGSTFSNQSPQVKRTLSSSSDPVFSLNPCVTQVAYSTIQSTCAANSGQVCTLAQIDSTKRTLSCGLTTTRVWTSTSCVNSKDPTAQAFWVAYGSGTDTTPQCSQTTSNQNHGLVCCPLASSSSPTTGLSPVSTSSPTSASITTTGAPQTTVSTSQPMPAPTGRPSTPSSLSTPSPSVTLPPTFCPTCPFSVQPCNANAVFSDAHAACASAGGRLCSESELQAPHNFNYPCSLATTRVWSSTTCVNKKAPNAVSYYVVNGQGSDASPQCSQTSSSQQHGILCCPSTSGPTTPPAPTFAPTNFYFVPGPLCVGLSVFSDAQNYCQSQSGRLCTEQEMQVAKSNLGCGVVGQRAWTSTTCVNPKVPTQVSYMVVLAEGKDTAPQCAQDGTQTKAVVCCASSSRLNTPTVSPVEYEDEITPNPSAGSAPIGNITTALSLPAAASRSLPMARNIIMIISDDLKPALRSFGDSLSNTPNIDRLASRGIRFSRAYTQYAECAPSRSSFLTGLSPDRIQVFDLSTNMRATVTNAVTIPMIFKALGYYTVALGKIFDDRATVDEDWATGCWTENPEFSNNNTHCYDKSRPVCVNPGYSASQCKCMDNPAFSLGLNSFPSIQNGTVAGKGPIMTDESYVDGRMGNYGRDKLTWLMNRPAGSPPFFFALGLWKPHLPFIAPSEWFDLFNASTIPLPAYPHNPKGMDSFFFSFFGKLKFIYPCCI